MKENIMDKKDYHILSWGGGTQSTALMIKFLKGEVKDSSGNPIELDYIFFADTNNESEMTYNQIYKVKKYIEDTYKKKIHITRKNKELLPDDEAIKLIQSGDIKSYRSSPYADLFQSHVLFFKGIIRSTDVMPFWLRDPVTGKVGKTGTKACTFAYKIAQVMKELRLQTGIKRFNPDKHKIYMYIGFSVDEFQRSKPSFYRYTENRFPLIDMNLTKTDCVNYVEKELGFRPVSSVCNMCYANDIDRVYDIYKNDPDGWERLIVLDSAMADKAPDHSMQKDVYMFSFQAYSNVRLRDIDFEEFYKTYKKTDEDRNLFNMEAEMACVGGCFI
jgi:hypothetical protein